jgi:hypothetical protein
MVVSKARQWLTTNWWWLIPVLLGIGVMLPRLASSQFGVEDDAVSIVKAQRMLAGGWSPADDLGAGRFRPLIG